MASIKSLRKVLGCIIILTRLSYCRAADGHHKVLAVEVDRRANFEDTDASGAGASGAGLMRSESDKSDESDESETDAPENLVKNGDFQQDFAHWQQYKPSRPNAAHQHRIAGKRLMHLHGHCYQTAGGVQQEITTQPGRSYTLKWSAFSGHWDGKKEVKFTVNFGDFTKTYKIDKSKKGPAITSSGRLMDPEKYEETVTASRGKTVLSFFAPMGHCMDIDDVVLTLDPTTTTTPKSAARGATVDVAMAMFATLATGISF